MIDLAEGLDRADAMMTAGRPEQAARLARTLIGQHPESARAHDVLADALRKQGHGREAVAPAREALRLDPHAPGMHIGLCLALLEVDKAEEAREHARRVIELLPNESGSHDLFAWTILKPERTDLLPDALAALRESIRLDPNVGPAHSMLGVALRRSGDRDAARAAFEQALALNPNDTTALTNLGAMDMGTGRLAHGADGMLSALSMDPNDQMLHHNMRILLARFGLVFTVLWVLTGITLGTMLTLGASPGTRLVTGAVWLLATAVDAWLALRVMPRNVRRSPRRVSDLVTSNEKLLLAFQVVPALGVAVMAFTPGLVAATAGAIIVVYLVVVIVGMLLAGDEEEDEDVAEEDGDEGNGVGSGGVTAGNGDD